MHNSYHLEYMFTVYNNDKLTRYIYVHICMYRMYYNELCHYKPYREQRRYTCYTPSNKENSPRNEWMNVMNVIHRAEEALDHRKNHTWFFLILKELFEPNGVP